MCPQLTSVSATETGSLSNVPCLAPNLEFPQNIFDGPGRVNPEIEKIVMHDEAIAINQ